MTVSVFTRIIRGELPAYKIYEDERTLAFLDIHPISSGHTLVIPKTEVDQLWDLDEADYQAVMTTVKKVALRLRSVLPVERVGVKVVGVDVPHAHVQLIPFTDVSQFNAPQDLAAEPNQAELKALAEKLVMPREV